MTTKTADEMMKELGLNKPKNMFFFKALLGSVLILTGLVIASSFWIGLVVGQRLGFSWLQSLAIAYLSVYVIFVKKW
jgi:hypothetical protein